MDDSVPIKERKGAMQALQEAGKIRYIGLNNATVEQLDEAWATGVRFHTLQVRYSMFSRRHVEAHILPWCEAHGVGILAHSVLGKGLLTGRYAPGHVFAPDDERSNMVDFHGENFAAFCAAVDKLKVIAERKGRSMVELATGWVLRQKGVTVALVGGKSPEQVEANAKHTYDMFTEEDLAEIAAILEGAPEICWEITNGGADTPAQNEARAKVGLPPVEAHPLK
jgi:aryl-alcohol dehydrogenase-like predicted oxidoreductase